MVTGSDGLAYHARLCGGFADSPQQAEKGPVKGRGDAVPFTRRNDGPGQRLDL